MPHYRVERANLHSIDGLLLKKEDKFLTVVNVCRLPTRQRFTIAHELVHSFLFGKEGDELRKAIGNPLARFEEDICDSVASEILMPAQLFRQHASQFGFSIDAVEPLSTIFQTSMTSVAIRLAYLNRGCFAVIWKPAKVRDDKGRLLFRGTVYGSGLPIGKGPGRFVSKYFGAESPVYKAYESRDCTVGEECFQIGRTKRPYRIESKGLLYGDDIGVLSLFDPVLS